MKRTALQFWEESRQLQVLEREVIMLTRKFGASQAWVTLLFCRHWESYGTVQSALAVTKAHISQRKIEDETYRTIQDAMEAEWRRLDIAPRQ
jgi:hypothetical protein